MKLSELMKKEIDGVDGEYLLECADSSLDPSQANVTLKKEVTLMYTFKKIMTVAASFALAIAAILSFILIRASLDISSDIPLDSVSEDIEDVNETSVPNEETEAPDVIEEKSDYYHETREEYGTIVSNTIASFGDYVFYINGIDDIRYVNVNSETPDSASIFDGMENKNEFFSENKMHFMHIAVDRYASDRNDGYPVLIIGFMYKIKNFNPEYTDCSFISYDMKTNTVKKLATELGDNIANFEIYGDYIFTTCTPSSFGRKYIIYRIALDGSETEILTETEATHPTILLNVENKYVYFYRDDEAVYTTTHDFEETRKINNYANVFGQGEDIYVIGGMTEIDLEGTTLWHYDLMKTDINDTIEHEVLVENIAGAFRAANKLYYFKAEPTYYGGKLCISKNVIYSYDLQTEEETVVADLTAIDKHISIYGWSEDALLLNIVEYEDGVSVDKGIYHYSIETKTLTEAISYKKSGNVSCEIE